MGEVYLPEDTRLDRKVALKILPSDCVVDQDRMMRFVREAMLQLPFTKSLKKQAEVR